jgi:hypothetical protein
MRARYAAALRQKLADIRVLRPVRIDRLLAQIRGCPPRDKSWRRNTRFDDWRRLAFILSFSEYCIKTHGKLWLCMSYICMADSQDQAGDASGFSI